MNKYFTIFIGIACFLVLFTFNASALVFDVDISKCRGKPTCEWSFGDGEISPSCGHQNHVYEEPGTYTATFRYNCGCLSQETTHEINVTAGYSWITDSWSECQDACGESLKTRNVLCERQDGVIADASKCNSTDKPDSTDICTDYSTCSYSWDYTEWNVPEGCGEVTATRSYECLRSDGTIVADSECESRIGAANATDTRTVHDACTYSWNEHGDWSECSADPTWSDWSDCSAECGGGNQTRTCQDTEGTQSQTVTCVRGQTDETVVDSYCSGEKPDTRSCTESCTGDSTQICNTQDCIDCTEECRFRNEYGASESKPAFWTYQDGWKSKYEIYWYDDNPDDFWKDKICGTGWIDSSLGRDYDFSCEHNGYRYYKKGGLQDSRYLGNSEWFMFKVCRKPVSCFN